MKKIYRKIKKKLPLIILILIVGGACFFIGRRIGLNTDTSSSNTTIEDVKVSKQTIKKTLTSSGQIAKVKIPALNDRELTGYVTNISNTLENGRFTVTVEFDNDGDIRIGMSVNVTL